MILQIGQADRATFLDQETEDAAPARAITDLVLLLFGQAGDNEALERLAVRRQHADRGVARADELSREVGHSLQNRTQLQLGNECREFANQSLDSELRRLRW